MEHFNEIPEPTEEQLLRLRISHLENDLQWAHDQNRRLRKQLTSAQNVLGIEDGERAA